MADEDTTLEVPVETVEASPETPTPEPAPAPVAVQPPPASQSVLGEIGRRIPVEVASDEMDARFQRARSTIEADEMLSASDKEMKLLELEMMRERRQERRQQGAESNEERIRNGYAKQYDQPRAVVDSTWQDSATESVRRRGRFDHGTAMTVFEDRMTAMAASKKPPETEEIPEKKPVGQTRIEPRGARRAPAQPEKKLTVQEIMDRASMGDFSSIPADVLAEAKR